MPHLSHENQPPGPRDSHELDADFNAVCAWPGASACIRRLSGWRLSGERPNPACERGADDAWEYGSARLAADAVQLATPVDTAKTIRKGAFYEKRDDA